MYLTAITFILIGFMLVYSIGFFNIKHNNIERILSFVGPLFVMIGLIIAIINYKNVEKNLDELKYQEQYPDNTFYYIGAEIVDQSVAGTTVFETEDGYQYKIETNPEWDWDCIYLLTMDDNATPYDKTDDSICVVWAEVSKTY